MENEIIEKGRVGPGQMIAINFKEKNFILMVKLKNIYQRLNLLVNGQKILHI